MMESLAFNIMARIDDLLYVDDATKQRAAAESTSLYNQTRFNGAVPKQKRISPSPFSIQRSPSASPFRIPSFYSLKAMVRSPGRAPTQSCLKRSNLRDPLDGALEKLSF